MSAAADRVLQAAQKCDSALSALYKAFQDADQRDFQLVATLREKHNIPHLFSLPAEAQSKVMDSIAALAREHPDL